MAGSPAWLEEAKAQMRAERKLGIVLRIPHDPESRHDLGHAIEGIVNSEDPAVRELGETLVFVCLDSDAIQDQLPGARPEDTVVAIFADGDPFDGATVSPRQLERDFVEQVTRLLRRNIDRERHATSGDRSGRLLPYGIKFGRGSACGDPCEEQKRDRHTAVRCGMAFAGPGYRSFIRFLSPRSGASKP